MSMTDDKPSNMLMRVNYVNIFKKMKISISIMVLRIEIHLWSQMQLHK